MSVSRWVQLALATVFFLNSATGHGAEKISWWEGEVEREVWLDSQWAAQLKVAKVLHADPWVTLVPVRRKAQQNQLKRGEVPQNWRDLHPVFRSNPTGGEKMVALKKVLVTFAPNTTREVIEEWAKEHSVLLIEKLKFSDVMYVFSAPGDLATIEMANHLRSMKPAIGAEPIWWKQREAK